MYILVSASRVSAQNITLSIVSNLITNVTQISNQNNISGITQSETNLFDRLQRLDLSIEEIDKEVSNPKIPNIFIHVKGGEISPINRLIQLPSYAKEIPDLQANLTIEEMSDQIEKPSKTLIPGGLAEKVIKPAKSVFAIADEKDALTKSFRTYMSEVPSINRVILIGRAKLTNEELATILQFLEGKSLTIEQVNATAKEITKLRAK
ncbi:POTRA domain-containing protein [Phormidium tenue]|uniref:Uncharacterized protein n=1 Tax=Phormidium tenue FACHB-1050 TaxID=2692857 RepID=A0ABR8CFZ4_9CYAN|nr:POTRA domain-containing protein [Phormidium tenue]MBD2319228.1 hypothetical protein [Phormidium tenue FACHB-1050]